MTIEDGDVAKVFKFGHERSSLAGVEIYETRWPTNNKSFEIQEWGSGGVLGRKCEVIKRRSVSETFEGCGEKGPRRRWGNVEKDN